MKPSMLRLIALFGLLGFVWGCQSDVGMSRAVRNGDTIAISLGNSDVNDSDPASLTFANVSAPLLKKANITAQISSDSAPSVFYDITIRHVFRTFSDPTSWHVPIRGKGMWIAILDLADSAGVPTPLPVGDAKIKLTSADFRGDHSVDIYITGDSGVPHQFISKTWPITFFSKFIAVEPGYQALVKATGTLPANEKLGAALYVFDIPDEDNFGDPAIPYYAAAPARFAGSEQVSFHVVKDPTLDHPQGYRVKVYLTAPDGLDDTQLDNFDFYMTSNLVSVTNIPGYWQNHYRSRQFYNTDGEEITSPSLQHEIGLME